MKEDSEHTNDSISNIKERANGLATESSQIALFMVKALQRYTKKPNIANFRKKMLAKRPAPDRNGPLK